MDTVLRPAFRSALVADPRLGHLDRAAMSQADQIANAIRRAEARHSTKSPEEQVEELVRFILDVVSVDDDERELLDWIKAQGGTAHNALGMLQEWTTMMTKAYSRGRVEGMRMAEGSGVRPQIEDWHGKAQGG